MTRSELVEWSKQYVVFMVLLVAMVLINLGI